jgi:hypothetical protein
VGAVCVSRLVFRVLRAHGARQEAPTATVNMGVMMLSGGCVATVTGSVDADCPSPIYEH